MPAPHRPAAGWVPFDVGGDAWPALGPAEVHVHLFRVDGSADDLSASMPLLDEGERERSARFVFAEDRTRYVASHATLRRLLGRYAGLSPQSLRFAVAAGGKPGLADEALAARLSFNLSHSGAWGLVGVAGGAPVGIDIEVHRPLPETQALAARHFSASEQARLLDLPAAQREAAFFACWTRKEACVKAIGTGLATPLDRFEVAFAPAESARLLTIEGSAVAARAWTLVDLASGGGTTAALAIRLRSPTLRRFHAGAVAGRSS